MVREPTLPAPQAPAWLKSYPLLEALHGRRSRRFGLGMKLAHGPLAYQSRHEPLPLSEDEEALLAFAACGITGPALGELEYARGRGGTMLAGWMGRTISSADAVQSVALVVANDQATYLLRRPQDFAPVERAELLALAGQGAYAELYRRMRVKLQDGRAAAPTEPLNNFMINAWALYAPGGSYFLPINELTFLYINALLEVFDEATGAYIVDERAGFRSAGLARFARSKGGQLYDDPDSNRVGTIQRLELAIAEGIAVEQGMLLQNIGLMAQAIGLGGYTHSSPHEYAWLQTLGFRMRRMPASRYLGANRVLSAAARLLGKDRPVSFAVGLEREGQVLLKGYCPPYFPSMAAAVRAVVEAKFGPQGAFRAGTQSGAWQEPQGIASAAARPSDTAIAATVAYCTYIYERYGRFPAYAPPFRTVAAYQATHVDTDYYDRFYQPEALTQTQRTHLAQWHGRKDVGDGQQ